MKKISRRNFLLASGVVTIGAALAACGGSSSSTAASSAAPASSAAASALRLSFENTSASKAPFCTKSPVFLYRYTPAVISISSSFVSLPAPACCEASPIFFAGRFAMYPSVLLVIPIRYFAGLKMLRSFMTLGFPPCAATNSANFASALPSFIAFSAIFLPSTGLSAFSPRYIIIPAIVSESSVKSEGPFPLSVSIASFTSMLLPTAFPSG